MQEATIGAAADVIEDVGGVDQGMDGVPDVGSRIRNVRKQRGWTLLDACERCNIGRSTLTKIESGQMSPTVGLLQRIAHGLEVDITALLSSAATMPASGRRAITRAGSGRTHLSNGNTHEVLCAELSRKRMLPFRSTIRAGTGKALPPWHRHEGEEFVFVLEGRVTLHSEFYAPAELGPGDSVYLDGRMGHCVVAAGESDAQVLFVMSDTL